MTNTSAGDIRSTGCLLLRKEGKDIYKDFLNRVFDESATLIDFKVERDGSSDELLSGALMRTDSGFELRVDRSLGENTIHPDTLEGAGEIRF